MNLNSSDNSRKPKLHTSGYFQNKEHRYSIIKWDGCYRLWATTTLTTVIWNFRFFAYPQSLLCYLLNLRHILLQFACYGSLISKTIIRKSCYLNCTAGIAGILSILKIWEITVPPRFENGVVRNFLQDDFLWLPEHTWKIRFLLIRWFLIYPYFLMPFVSWYNMKIPHACARIILSLENALTNSKCDHRPLTSPNQGRPPRDWLLHARVFGELATAVAILNLSAYCFELSYAHSPGLLSTLSACNLPSLLN